MSSSVERPDGARISPLWKAFAAPGLPWPWAGLIGMVLSLQLVLIWTHAPWADELQATALARQSHGLADWYGNFRYEGHPPLWHLLLKIPLAFTDDPTALKIVQSFVVLCSAGLLHLRAPFTPGVKFLLSLNYFLFFEYGVIARNYSLTVLFFFAAIAFRRRPVAWLFLALLPQGGLQSVMLAGICGLIVLREQGWRWSGVLVAGVGGLAALIWMWPAEDFESINTLRIDAPLLDKIMWAAYMNGATFLPIDLDLQLTGWDISRLEHLIIFFGLYGPMLAIQHMSRKSRFLACMTAFFIGSNFVLCCVIYTIYARHFGLWVVLMIGMLWVTHKPIEPMANIVRVWMVILALGGAAAALRQALTPFTVGPKSMEALREAGGLTQLIIPVNTMVGAEAHGLLRTPTFDVAGGCMQTFVRWRSPIFLSRSWIARDPDRRAKDPIGSALTEMKEVAARAGGRALLLFDDPEVADLMSKLNDPALSLLRIVMPEGSERLYRSVYRLDVPPDPNPTPIPPCIR